MTRRPEKLPYQVAWSSPVYMDEDWVGHLDCEATNAVTAIRQARQHLHAVHGLASRDIIIREVYKI